MTRVLKHLHPSPPSITCQLAIKNKNKKVKGEWMAQNVWNLNRSLLSESWCERSTFIERLSGEVILVKPIPSAAVEQVFALTRERIFWLVLELFSHILLCFGCKRGIKKSSVKLSNWRKEISKESFCPVCSTEDAGALRPWSGLCADSTAGYILGRFRNISSDKCIFLCTNQVYGTLISTITKSQNRLMQWDSIANHRISRNWLNAAFGRKKNMYLGGTFPGDC